MCRCEAQAGGALWNRCRWYVLVGARDVTALFRLSKEVSNAVLFAGKKTGGLSVGVDVPV